jgi:hypothetical protein
LLISCVIPLYAIVSLNSLKKSMKTLSYNCACSRQNSVYNTLEMISMPMDIFGRKARTLARTIFLWKKAVFDTWKMGEFPDFGYQCLASDKGTSFERTNVIYYVSFGYMTVFYLCMGNRCICSRSFIRKCCFGKHLFKLFTFDFFFMCVI